MGRILLILVGLLAVVLLVPSLRERVRPQIEYVVNPIYRWEAKNRVNQIHRVLERERAQGSTLPTPRDFHRFLSTREGPEAAVDPWDQPYYLVLGRRTLRVGSSGPDRQRNTVDDILSEPRAATQP